jgi:hypothetical protein
MKTCAAPSCDNPVPPSPRGRPPIYCSPACRPSRQPRSSSVYVEIDHPATSADGRPVERLWTVRLRRGNRAVVIADNLGWPSANALAHELFDLLTPTRGAAID